MRIQALRAMGLALISAAAALPGAGPARAGCPNPVPFFQGYTRNGHFAGCGDAQAYFFYWEHHRAVQRVWGDDIATTGPAGNDSGALGSIRDSVMAPYDRTGREGKPTPGAYRLVMNQWDWSNIGSDGCIVNRPEADPSCLHGGNFSLPVLDFVIAGSDAADRLLAKAAVLSVDGNERNQFWILDQAGAPSMDGKPCGADASSYALEPVTCGRIPAPRIVSPVRCDSTGCSLSVAVDPADVPFLDDCAVANSRSINCPRDLLAGRGVFVKRAPCNATSPEKVGFFDTRSFRMDSRKGSITRNFVPYAPQDANLNGVRDGSEPPHAALVVKGNAGQTVPVRIPKIAGAADCAYLAVGLVLDSAPSTSDCGGPCEPVVTPLLSVHPTPFVLNTASPAADRVVNLVADRSAGKAEVSWDTTAEISVAGFHLIGTRKDGGTVRLRPNLIQARKGTTGEGAHYSVTLAAGALKGLTAVHVEMVRTGGARERFGPAGFLETRLP
mgnify:CR=1 FL=1